MGRLRERRPLSQVFDSMLQIRFIHFFMIQWRGVIMS